MGTPGVIVRGINGIKRRAGGLNRFNAAGESCCCNGPGGCVAPLGMVALDGDNPFGCQDSGFAHIANMVVTVSATQTIFRRITDFDHHYEEDEVYEVDGTLSVALGVSGPSNALYVVGTLVGGSVAMTARFERRWNAGRNVGSPAEGEDDFTRSATSAEINSLVASGYAIGSLNSWDFGSGRGDPFFANYNPNRLTNLKIKPRVIPCGTRLIDWLVHTPPTDDDYCQVGPIGQWFLWNPNSRGLILPGSTVCASQSNAIIVNYTGRGSFDWNRDDRQDFDINYFTTQNIAGSQRIEWSPC